jgi:hypothetical protein
VTKLLRCAFGKACAWLTGKFLGEVAVSAVVTLAMAGMFTRPASNHEAPLPSHPPTVVAAAAAAEPTRHWLDFPLDFGTTASLAHDAASSARVRLPAPAAKPQATATDETVPLPPRRPADIDSAVAVPVHEPKPRLLPQVDPTATQALVAPRSLACSGTTDDAPCPPGLIPDDRLTANASLAGPGGEPELIAPEDSQGPTRLWPLPRGLGVTVIRQTLAGLASRF